MNFVFWLKDKVLEMCFLVSSEQEKFDFEKSVSRFLNLYLQNKSLVNRLFKRSVLFHRPVFIFV